MNIQLQSLKPLGSYRWSRRVLSRSAVDKPAEELALELTSGELKKCAQLFDEYNRSDCSIYFLDLLVTPRSDRAEKIMFCFDGFWKQIHCGALTGRLPTMFELDQFRSDCKELSGYLARISAIARLAPEPFCREVNRWVSNYSSSTDL